MHSPQLKNLFSTANQSIIESLITIIFIGCYFYYSLAPDSKFKSTNHAFTQKYPLSLPYEETKPYF